MIAPFMTLRADQRSGSRGEALWTEGYGIRTPLAVTTGPDLQLPVAGELRVKG